jgi:hypothetical protein
MNSKMKLVLLAAAVISVVTALSLRSSSPQQAIITIDSNKTYQTMTGWEATAQIGHQEFPASQVQRWSDAVLTQAVDLGINRLRVPITSGAENSHDWYGDFRAGLIPWNGWLKHRYETINDNADPNLTNPNGFHWSFLDHSIEAVYLPLRQKLAAQGEQLYLNVNYTDFGDPPTSNFQHRDNPAEYAEFVLATYRHLQSKYGFVPDCWEVMLEPDNDTGWTATQMGQVIAAAGDRLAAAGFTPRFVAPSVEKAPEAYYYLNDIVAVPGAQRYLREVSYHRYQNVDNQQLATLRVRAKQLGMDMAMLEWIGATYSALHDDLKVGENSAWQEYTLAYPGSDSEGGAYFAISNPGSPTPVVSLRSHAKFFRQYFKYVRAGARRIDAQSNNSSFDPVAFTNTDGKQVVVVKASSAGSFNIHGLSAGTYGIMYTTSSEYDVKPPQLSIGRGQMVSASIPAAGVITIFGTTGAKSSPRSGTALRNMAVAKQAIQASTASGAEASRAVDNNTNGDLRANSVTLTNPGKEPWWQIDLGSIGDIDHIDVWNRTDCCGDRLRNFYVLVSNVPMQSVALASTRNQPGVSSYYVKDQAGRPTRITVNRAGRYIRVQLADTNVLSLAEVEVWGRDALATTSFFTSSPSDAGSWRLEMPSKASMNSQEIPSVSSARG